MKTTHHYFKPLLASLTFSTVLLSCQKESGIESIENDTVSNLEVSINQYGMLRFENMDQFNKLLTELDNSPISDAEELGKTYKFTSYAADTLDDNKSAGDFDPILARVLNKNAAIQIADSLRFFTGNYDYNIHIDDTDVIQLAIEKSDFSHKKINPIKIQRSEFKLKKEGPMLRAATSSSVYNGNFRITTPESITADRPERAIFVIEDRQSSGYFRSYCFVYGQAYRKGGLFGSKKWRDDEINTLRYDLINARSTTGHVVGPLYDVVADGRTTTNIVSTNAPTNFHSTFDNLNVKIKTLKKKSSNDANYTISATLTRVGSQYHVTATTGW